MIGLPAKSGLGFLGSPYVFTAFCDVTFQPNPFHSMLFFPNKRSLGTRLTICGDLAVILSLLHLQARDLLLISLNLIEGFVKGLGQITINPCGGNAHENSDRDQKVQTQGFVAGLPVTVKEGGGHQFAELQARGHDDYGDGESADGTERQGYSPYAEISRASRDE